MADSRPGDRVASDQSEDETAPALRIDDFLPDPDVSVRRHVVVDATPEASIDAVRAMNFARMGPLVRLLSWIRAVPMDVERRRRGDPSPDEWDPPTLDRLAETADAPWMLLDATATELVVGAVGKPWRPAIEWASVEPEAFADFDETGWAKIAFSFVAHPYGRNRTLLSYDVRTTLTDPESRRRFRRYWTVVGVGAAYLMRQALRTAKRDAERSTPPREPISIPIQAPEK
jgi:hypothetical protein